MRPKGRDAQTAGQQNHATEQHHDGLCYDGDGEGQQWQNDERNTSLREHNREIGNRHRLPEQDAAIAAFAIESVWRVENADEEGRAQDQSRGEVIGMAERPALLRQVQR